MKILLAHCKSSSKSFRVMTCGSFLSIRTDLTSSYYILFDYVLDQNTRILSSPPQTAIHVFL